MSVHALSTTLRPSSVSGDWKSVTCARNRAARPSSGASSSSPGSSSSSVSSPAINASSSAARRWAGLARPVPSNSMPSASRTERAASVRAGSGHRSASRHQQLALGPPRGAHTTIHVSSSVTKASGTPASRHHFSARSRGLAAHESATTDASGRRASAVPGGQVNTPSRKRLGSSASCKPRSGRNVTPCSGTVTDSRDEMSEPATSWSSQPRRSPSIQVRNAARSAGSAVRSLTRERRSVRRMGSSGSSPWGKTLRSSVGVRNAPSGSTSASQSSVAARGSALGGRPVARPRGAISTRPGGRGWSQRRGRRASPDR